MADETAIADALRRPNKGPADAVIRTVSLDEAEAAFNDDAGGKGDFPGAHKVGGNGARGSVAGVRIGVTNSEGRPVGPAGGLDARAAENLRIRRERARLAAGGGQAATPTPPARTLVQAPSQAPLEDWELPAQEAPAAPLAPAPVRQPIIPAEVGDALERARLRALHTLASIPIGMELYVGGEGLDPSGVEFVMGLGLLVGKGLAVYRGGSHYRLNQEGRLTAATEGYGA